MSVRSVNERLEKERKVELKAVISFVVILAIIVATVLGVIALAMSKQKAKEEDKQRIIPAVDVMVVSKADFPVRIDTQGVVESARQTQLAAEVKGRVMEISPNLRRGGMVKKGERLVQIDPSDYRSALAAAEVAQAESELVLEQERAKVEQAKLDWEKLGRGNPINPLVLRKPYLAAAEARAESAVQESARARRDVERTEILAPFDAGVRMAAVEIGAVVAPGATVAELYANEDLEVRLPLGLEDFGFLKKNEGGMIQGEVILRGKIGTETFEWKADPVRIDPEIQRQTLSANVVVKVLKNNAGEFPYPPVGLFVSVELDGKTLPQVAEIPRRGLLEGNRVIVVEDGNKIASRDVTVLRLNEKTAVVSEGLQVGERVVLTRLSAPVIGMEVEIESTEKEAQ